MSPSPHFPGLRRAFRLPAEERASAAVDEEIGFHIDMLAEELEATGLAPEIARREALRRFGDPDRVRDRCRTIATRAEHSMRLADRLSGLRQDLSYAVRTLLRAPGYTTVVLLTLALGIGATTAIFSVVRGVLLRPLPFRAPEQLVRVSPANPGANVPKGPVSENEVADWQTGTRMLSSVAGFSTIGGGLTLTEGEPTLLRGAQITPTFFTTLGSTPAIGRAILPEEHRPGANRVLVLSDHAWRTYFNADRAVVGRTKHFANGEYTIVGVMPPSFTFPAPDVELWMPSSLVPEDAIPRQRQNRWMNLVARLAPRVTEERALPELIAFNRRLAAAYPQSNAGWTSADVTPLRDALVGKVRKGLYVLLGAVALVLLIACVNVASLTLARATTREREVAVRTALGAGRGRLISQLLTESVLLSLAGGALGLLLANYGVRALVALSAGYLPRAVDVKVDGFVLAFALLVSLLSGIGFGLAPALRGSHADPGDALRGGSRGATGGARGNRLRTSLVVAQVALAVVLVTGSGLMLRSFSHLLAVDLGFEPESALLVRFVVPSNTDIKTPEIHAYRQRMLERVRQIPGILAAGTTTFTPLAGRTGEPREFTVPGMPTPRSGEEPRADTYPVTPGYFRAMGIPLLAGRDLVSGDTVGDDALVAVINRTMAERFFPKGHAVDGRIEIGPKAELRVVGVVADVRAERVDSAPSYTMYVPTNLMTRVNVSMVARTSRDPASMIPAVRAAMREIDPSLPFTQITPMRSVVSDAVATPRFFTVLVVIFGLSALALAMVGLYGVVAYVVAQRRREIAIRMALGAPAAGVVRLMLGRGLLPVGVGLAIGLVVAVASSHLLASLLYEVSPTDPITLAAVALLLGTVGALAAYLPARRASRVRPAETLRGEG